MLQRRTKKGEVETTTASERTAGTKLAQSNLEGTGSVVASAQEVKSLFWLSKSITNK
jgi:hypothetical protein